MSEPFRFLLRVRYGECDAQGVVFNARWGDYVDVAVTEYQRAMFGSAQAADTGVDWKLVKQTLEWRVGARYDDVIDCRISTARIGTTSFTFVTQFRRFADGEDLATAETVYVACDHTGSKQAIGDAYRAALERGAPGIVVDHAGAAAPLTIICRSMGRMLDVKSKVSEAEWQLRVDLAAAYRLVALYGWDDLIFTHISARLPGTEHHFLINPYGMTFDEVTASSLVKVDLDGKKLMDGPYEINPAGFTIHSAIHAAREDAKCVMHTHSLNGVAVSATKGGVLPVSQQSIFVLSSLAYHSYEGVALLEGEKPRLVRDLGDKNFFMLRNHGLLTVGASIADAFLLMYLFESACTIQLRAQATSAELIPIDQKIVAGAQMMAKQVTRSAGGGLAWPALLRKLDRIDRSYRD